MRTTTLSDVALTMRNIMRSYVVQQGITLPVPLEDLVAAARWDVVSLPMPGRLEAAAIFDEQFIVVNPRFSPAAQRFALAHEFVHTQHHARHLTTQWDYRAHPYSALFEVEANAGAAELLLPYDWFMDHAYDLVGDRLRTQEDVTLFFRTSEARRWAHQAQVTPRVLQYHLIDLGWVRSQRP